MRKLIWVCFVLLAAGPVGAQKYLEPDTVRRNEFSVGIQPVLDISGGSFRPTTYTNFNFGFRHYLKKPYVLRTAFVVFPTSVVNPYEAGNIFYDRTVDNKNVFRASWYSGRPKLQANIGLEKIYRYNRLIHGWGAELFVNHVSISYDDHYFYRYLGQGLSVLPPPGDTTNYNVDSLRYHRTEKKTGIGLQVFYSLRYKINKHFYISATVGPSACFSFVNIETYRQSTGVVRSQAYDFNAPNVGLISDVSICFRF